jgi:hypothetical protein
VARPSGAAGFARFAFPPNELGHCGPPGAHDLLAAGAGGRHDLDLLRLRDRASRFEGAWPYLQLLAGERDTGELDADVVAAYWVGGPLLGDVDRTSFEGVVRHHFGDQPGLLDRLTTQPDVWATGPNHAFHVFVVYPWVGLLGTAGDTAASVLERCRVRWATVASVEGAAATVIGRPLRWSRGRLDLGPATPERVRWARGDHAFVEGLAPGDVVALHWDWVCDRLPPERLAALQAVTARQLDSTNRWLARR